MKERQPRELNRVTRTPIGIDGSRGETVVLTELPSELNRYTTKGELNEYDSRPLANPNVPDHVVIGGELIGGRVSVLLDENSTGKIMLPGEELTVSIPRRDLPPTGYSSDVPITASGAIRKQAHLAALKALGKDGVI